MEFGIKKTFFNISKRSNWRKPLYFGWQGEGNNKIFIFSSELKALKVHPGFNADLNKDAITLQLRHNCIPAFIQFIKIFINYYPGIICKSMNMNLKRLFHIKYQKVIGQYQNCAIFGANNQLRENENKIINDLENNLKKSVKKQMISDVPIGAFLSGGIDSST